MIDFIMYGLICLLIFFILKKLRTKLGIYLDLGRGKLMDAEYFYL